MTAQVSRRCQADHEARALPAGPLSGRRGARLGEVTCAAKERPVDTIAFARKPAEVRAA
jgi:hypothetical protein